MLSLAKSILAVVAIFNFMAPFTDFLFPRIVLRGLEKFTLALGLFNFINDQFNNNNNFTRFATGSNRFQFQRSCILTALFNLKYLTACGTKG
jgi:arabinogalactan oligomer / maltooligosaccharide transport system permease protein